MSTRTLLHTMIIGAAALWLPTAAQAQSWASDAPAVAVARAIKLHQKAVALYSQPEFAAEAARLHVQEAKLRSNGDPEAVENLMMAARLYGYAKLPRDARSTMEQAAERALKLGDVSTAAQAFLQAAFFAVDEKNADQTIRLAKKTMWVTKSPLLSAEQREAVRSRIKATPQFAGVIN